MKTFDEFKAVADAYIQMNESETVDTDLDEARNPPQMKPSELKKMLSDLDKQFRKIEDAMSNEMNYPESVSFKKIQAFENRIKKMYSNLWWEMQTMLSQMNK
jgi:hypothetical protein